MTADDYEQARLTIAVWRADGLPPWRCLEAVTGATLRWWQRDGIDWWAVAEAIAEDRKRMRQRPAKQRMAA